MNFNHPKDRTSCPRAWPCKSYNENAPFLEKSSFLLIGMDQTGEIQSDDDHERFYLSYKFQDPRGRCS